MSESSPRSSYRLFQYAMALVLGVVVVYTATTLVSREQLEDVRTTVELKIAQQQTVLASVAEVTARGGADAVVASIITDCSSGERGRFDTLLGTLDRGLTASELSELSRLFDRCGSFFAERKAVMVARMKREMEVYREFIDLLGTVTGGSPRERYEVGEWERLVAAEEQQSSLFSELVSLQGEIITSLEAGTSAGSDEIAALLQEVSQVRESLAVATVQAAELRADLNAL